MDLGNFPQERVPYPYPSPSLNVNKPLRNITLTKLKGKYLLVSSYKCSFSSEELKTGNIFVVQCYLSSVAFFWYEVYNWPRKNFQSIVFFVS